jgi:subfamily B ATP-binding cassette protein MsbA
VKPIEGNLTGFKAYRALLSLAFEHKLYFLLAFIGMIIFAATDAAFAYMMKPLMDEGFIDRDPKIIKLIPFAIVALFMVRMVAVFLRSYCMSYIGRHVINTLRRMMFEKLLTMTSDEYDQSSSASIVARFSYDVEQVSKAVSSSLTAFIQDSLRIIVIWLNWQLTAIFLVAGPVVFLIVVKISGRFRVISRNIQQSMGGVTQVAQEVIDGNRIVKIFGGDDFERDKFERKNRNNLKLHLKMSIAQAVSMPLIQLVVAIAFAAIVAFATSESMRDVVTTGDFVSFLFAMTMLLAPMRVLSSINANIQKGIAAGESVFELTSRDSEHNEGQLELERAKGSLQFDGVVLQYRRSEQRVLDEISFEVKPKQTVAIVGRSGSGKSSLVNLIPRLYEADSGKILLDGKPITEYNITDLRRQIAYVGQDARLFNDSIRNNIAYGVVNEVDESQIIEAARQAHAWEFIEDLPEQLDTEVGESGVLLSGGQRQRIAIARALLKDHRVGTLHPACDGALDGKSYHPGYRASPVDDRTCRPYPGHGERQNRRTGYPCQIAGKRRYLCQAPLDAVPRWQGRRCKNRRCQAKDYSLVGAQQIPDAKLGQPVVAKTAGLVAMVDESAIDSADAAVADLLPAEQPAAAGLPARFKALATTPGYDHRGWQHYPRRQWQNPDRGGAVPAIAGQGLSAGDHNARLQKWKRAQGANPARWYHRQCGR